MRVAEIGFELDVKAPVVVLLAQAELEAVLVRVGPMTAPTMSPWPVLVWPSVTNSWMCSSILRRSPS